MTPTTLPATLLPRARGLTDALVAPAGPPPPAAAVAALRRRLRQALEEAAAGAVAPVRVDGYALRDGGGPAGQGAPGGEPFRWTPRRARRALALPAAALVVGGRAAAPARAAAVVLEEVMSDGHRGARPGSLAAWLAAARDAVVAATLAEATAWATHLVTAVEWHRVSDAEIGEADRWWDLPGSGPVGLGGGPAPGGLGGHAPVGLRGRADVRLRVAAPLPAGGGIPAGPPLACLSMVGGRPGPGSRVELGLAALVEVARHPGEPVPARVVGWWPECGRALVLDVDEALLTSTAAAVVTAVRRRAAAAPGRLQDRGR